MGLSDNNGVDCPIKFFVEFRVKLERCFSRPYVLRSGQVRLPQDLNGNKLD